MLRERNEHVNLTSIVSPEGILTLHMLDSLSIVPDLRDARRVLDVGTGGGFPGLPLAVACPQREFMLIDGTQKKIRFVNESHRGARHPQCTRPLAARAERSRRARTYDAVIVRAVGNLADVLHNAGHLVAPEGRLHRDEGPHPDEGVARRAARLARESCPCCASRASTPSATLSLSRVRNARQMK